ncbi:esterase/lipase/thioesterase family protein [Pseudomonas saudimassiliensis]|uniref:Esterase/lipase/thioesterase family protein n=1 Tax=Pseudomonas saudimassiliensis TaxID=1461581 RepID=A0A078MDK0_9PSED|nr:carboxylesterase family protein [Pseudomonas saudimassiliensis]CEA05453.1 esterase/lipase/thioesterase family protein [Pseudomonas saudimassiliensis]CEF27143.1 esterase/lipase/thioesterase family protein [Pseudomonas saudimassiliensis]
MQKNRTKPTGFMLSTVSAVVLAVSLSGCLSSGGGGSSKSERDPLRVSTAQGDYVGINASGMKVYRGIRYGVAERFGSPEFPPAHSKAIQLDESFGSACPQLASPFGEASVNEDCLFLNVYAPEEPGEYPVMVWIHGGAFIYGDGGETYDPQRLVEKGVVVVTLNYRLGALGFLPHADLENSNFGLQDQQLALRWVQENIAAFDGDPDNVTLFGESAGGHSVASQIASPGAEGLFHKAIIQSGAYNGTQLPLAAGQYAFATETLAKLGCATSDDLLGCLRSQTVEDILAAQAGNYLPVTGTPTLPVSIIEALATGDFNKVPVISGSNLEEGSLFTLLALADADDALRAVLAPALSDAVKDASYANSVGTLLQEDPRLDAEQIASDYLARFASLPAPDKYIAAHAAIGTDWRFNCPNSTQWQLLKDQVPTWGYWFTERNAPALPGLAAPFPLGATHTAEIQFVLSSNETLTERGATEDHLALAEHMASYWTNFARYGDDPAIGPNGTDGSGSLPAWDPVSDAGFVNNLVAPTPTASSKAAFDAAHQCGYWNAPPVLPEEDVLPQ